MPDAPSRPAAPGPLRVFIADDEAPARARLTTLLDDLRRAQLLPFSTVFFMVTAEAVGLVLQASVLEAAADVFVLDMGEPVRIVDLARTMIELSGLRVSEVCLGTMTFGNQADEATSFAIMDAAVEGGITFFDSADVYPLGWAPEDNGETEAIMGRWFAAHGNRESDRRDADLMLEWFGWARWNVVFDVAFNDPANWKTIAFRDPDTGEFRMLT